MTQAGPRHSLGRTPSRDNTRIESRQAAAHISPRTRLCACGWIGAGQLCLAMMAAVPIGPARAQEAGSSWQDAMAEADWDWHAGDLIFRSGLDPLDELIATATGAPFASVGLLRASSGGPRVVYVDPTDGVTEAMLFEFIDGLAADEYAVYRLEAATGWGPSDSPVSYNALLVAYGQPADPYRLPGGTAYYGAELVTLAALGTGTMLGTPSRIGTLAEAAPELETAFLADWQEHPYCRYVVTKAECWDVIDDLAILTTASIMTDPALRQVYP